MSAIQMTALEALTLGRSHGITPANLHALLVVMTDPPMMTADLSNHLGVSPAATTGILDSLQKSGMIERLPKPGDRRSVMVTPTLWAFEVFQPSIKEEQP